MVTALSSDVSLQLGSHRLNSRLIVGTGKYATYELMQQCLEVSEAEVITVAIRRERLLDKNGRNILDFIDLSRYTILPNTAGCFTADDAVRVARLGREILEGLENPLPAADRAASRHDRRRPRLFQPPRSHRIVGRVAQYLKPVCNQLLRRM